MTNVQEELTVALERRAEAVAVENRLDAILDHHNIIRFSSGNGADPRRHRLLVIAASVVVVLGVGGLLWADRSRTQPPAASSSTPTPVDTSPDATSVSTPGLTPSTIPTAGVPPTSAPVTTMPVTGPLETNPPGWVAPAATLPALTDVSSVVPPTVLGTGPTDWYRLQPDLDVAWYSDGGDQSMLCFRTPAGQDCQLDRFAPSASGGGPIGVRSVDDQLLVVTLDPASPVTVTFDNGQTVTRPFETDEQIGWGVARVQMPPAGTPEGLSMLFDTAQGGSANSASPMTTVPTSEPVPSITG